MEDQKTATSDGRPCVLPEYLGLALLDRQFFLASKGRLVAQYTLDGEPVYRVDVASDGSCWLEEVYSGRTIMASRGQTLEKAFRHHFLVLVSEDVWLRRHPRLAALSRQIITLENIYFHRPLADVPPMIFFPAGLIYRLTLPVVERNYEVWEQFRRRNVQAGGPLGVIAEREGAILRFLPEGGAAVAENVLLAECHVLLRDLVEATTLVSQQPGLILPEKEYRLIVCDVTSTPPDLLAIYPGERERGFTAFAVRPLGNEPSLSPQVIEQFQNSARRIAP